MFTIEHDFFPIYRDIDGRAYVLLGTNVSKPELHSLQESQTISIVMPEQLQAEAVVHILPHKGFLEYRGYIIGEIADIEPESTYIASSTE